jgi:hypothetical protein
MYEKRMLREIFRPETEEEIGGSRKLHSEDLHNLFAIYGLCLAQQPPVGQGLLIQEVSRSHRKMHHSQ